MLEKIKVKPISETLQYILAHQSSVVRFGDGEIDLINGTSIPYQRYDRELAKRLKDILQLPSSEKLLVCLPDVFEYLERYNSNARLFWESHFKKYQTFYQVVCHSAWYGSTFLSRPYIDLQDKSQSAAYFAAIRRLWDNREILIVEGETSRSGVGNDLFANAKSVSRIICPSKNAFTHYETILGKVTAQAAGKLVLSMLGPTAKLLSYDLSQKGFQAIDLGHIDSEYEWFKVQATHKIKLDHKHTAEFNADEGILPVEDASYYAEIIDTVGVSLPKRGETNLKKDKPLISVIVPVYNVQNYLKRCVDSLLNQSYTQLDIILVNDGSTDGSGPICEDLARQDKRIRVFHQENAGVSAARNFALRQAQGDYVTFVDSDDFVEESYLEHLYTALHKNDADIAICNFTSFNEERQSFLFFLKSEDYFEKIYTVQEWLGQETMARYNMYLVFAFSTLKLFKRELFEGIYFPLHRVREDDATIYKLYLKAKRIAYINEGTYYYSQRSDSLSHTVMQADIATMISNAEERISLLALLGYDISQLVVSYLQRLYKCQKDALNAGQIELYAQLSTKINLYEHYRQKEN